MPRANEAEGATSRGKGRSASLKAAAKPGGAITLPSKPAKKSLKTSRRPKTTRVERTRAGGEWTESSFFSYIRSGLRQLSRRWPPIVRGVWLESRRAYHGTNARQKWEYQCAKCAGWAMRKEMQADHIVPCGTLTTWDDLPIFARRLFCEVDNLRILCEECHKGRRDGD